MSTATTSVFLFIGLDTQRRLTTNNWPDLDHMNGFMGLVDRIASMASVIGDWELSEHPDAYYPGVFNYEVTEELGAWLFNNLDCTPEEFRAELVRYVAEWRKETA